jgi:protein-S-isoprenylcysteine O-methyltransferase Ste14
MTDTRAYLWISHNPVRLYVVALLAGLFVDYIAPMNMIGLWLQFALGLPLLVAGAALIIWVSEAGRHKPPVPEPPPSDFNMAAQARLITGGPYRYLRHPFYLALALGYAGIAVLLDLPVTLVLLAAVLLIVGRRIVPEEEREMARRYGERWRAYAAAVPRWGYAPARARPAPPAGSRH